MTDIKYQMNLLISVILGICDKHIAVKKNLVTKQKENNN